MKTLLWDLLAWAGYCLLAGIFILVLSFFVGESLPAVLAIVLVAEKFRLSSRIDALQKRFDTLGDKNEPVA